MSSYPQQPGYPPQGYPQQPGQSFYPRYDPADLSKPLYGATIGQAVVRFWKKYVVFSGRASRSEFWWWYLVAAIVSIVLTTVNYVIVGVYVPPPATGTDFDPRQIFVDSMLHSLKASIASTIWSLAIFVGQIAVSVRRLHDTGRSGWWYLISLIPLVGAIILLVFCIEGPKPEGQRYDR